MGQKVNPIGFRTGITIGWKSRWFAPKSNFGEFLVEDEKIRRFIDERLNRRPPYAAVSSVEIDRTREEVKITLNTARPGLVIGPKGAEVDKLKDALEDVTDRRVSINIVEIRRPDLDAVLMAESISEQLKRRASFRRVIKQRLEACMQAGAKGVKITVGGRLSGAEIARSQTQLRGSIPLHTLEADVDYGFAVAVTTYGCIGVKVWIYRGMFAEQAQQEEEEMKAGAAMTRGRRRFQRRGGEARERGEGRGPPARRAPAAKRPAKSAAAKVPAHLSADLSAGASAEAEASAKGDEAPPAEGQPAPDETGSGESSGTEQ